MEAKEIFKKDYFTPDFIKYERLSEKSMLRLSGGQGIGGKINYRVTVRTYNATIDEEDRNFYLSKFFFSRVIVEDYIKQLKVRFFKEKL